MSSWIKKALLASMFIFAGAEVMAMNNNQVWLTMLLYH